MTTKSQFVTLHLDPDDRLSAAVGGAVRYMADAAGLDNQAILQLQTSVVSACRHFFDATHAHSSIIARIQKMDDRIQVELEGAENKFSVGYTTPTWAGIDEVQNVSVNGAAKLHLTKFIPAQPPAN